MTIRTVLLAVTGTLVACASPTVSLAPETEFSADWTKFESIAKRHGSIVSLPPFERSPQASLDAVDDAIQSANAKLAKAQSAERAVVYPVLTQAEKVCREVRQESHHGPGSDCNQCHLVLNPVD